MRGQDLFHDEVEGPGAAGTKIVDIGLGVEQPVDMVDTQTVQSAILDHRQDAGMGMTEHRRQLHAHAGQVVDVEEAAIVDVVAGNAEVGDAPGL